MDYNIKKKIAKAKWTPPLTLKNEVVNSKM